MIKVKEFFVNVFFLLFFSMFASKSTQAYTLTLKPKFNCTDGKVLVQGNCISLDETEY